MAPISSALCENLESLSLSSRTKRLKVSSLNSVPCKTSLGNSSQNTHLTSGGLWEAAVKVMKSQLKRVIGETKFTFEEFATVLTQVKACLNSHPIAPLPCDDDTIESLTPDHFLIGRPLEALPDPPASCHSISLLKCWHLRQNLIRHLWKRWLGEYIDIICRFTKWHHLSHQMVIGMHSEYLLWKR